MRVGLMAENPLERAIFATGIVPLAMLEGYAPAYSRAILTATRWEFRLAERPTDRPRRRGLVGRVAHPVQTRCLRTRVVGHSACGFDFDHRFKARFGRGSGLVSTTGLAVRRLIRVPIGCSTAL
jgi:hypothetical protein